MSSGNGGAATVDFDRLQRDVDAVKSEMSSLAGQITQALNDLAESARSRAGRGYREARANVDSMVSDLGRQGSAAFDTAQDAATTLAETVEEAVAERPLAAIGLALGIGFLIGVTWRR